MIENLLWQKYRPKTINDIILLPRIRKLIKNGIDDNLILHGHYGTGKTSLSMILTEGKPVLSINTSLHTSIDVLRTDIKDYVSTMSGIFDPTDDYKYIFLDEFEEASSQYQNALKAFIESYSSRVRFILVTNHVHKVEQGVISRCTSVDFDPKTDEEVKFLKSNYKERLIDISKKENIDIEEIDIKKIVAHNFPDMRKMVNVLSNIKKTGRIDYNITTFDSKLKMDLYKDLINGDTTSLQGFVMDNFGPEKVQELFNLCGRPLIEVLMTKEKGIIDTTILGDIYSDVSEHSMWLSTIKGGDPVVVGISCLSKIQKKLLSFRNRK